jgi:hypothetical protein
MNLCEILDRMPAIFDPGEWAPDVSTKWKILVMSVKRKSPTLCVLTLYCKNTVFSVESKLEKMRNILSNYTDLFLMEHFLIFSFSKNHRHYNVPSIMPISVGACNICVFLSLLNYGQILRNVRTVILQNSRERGKPQHRLWPCGMNRRKDPAYDMEILTD